MNSTGGKVFHLGLLGWPLGHSLSPFMHNAALRVCGLEGDYQLFPVSPFPNGTDEIRALLDRIRSGEIHGLNVTIPYKQSVMPLLDELSPEARTIGAVNTISLQNGRLVGNNTDWNGFHDDLNEQMPGTQSKTGKALILGAGGAARSVVYALTRSNWPVSVSARRYDQAKNLAADFNGTGNTTALPYAEVDRLRDISLIINTTPVGMSPDTQSSPWPANMPFPPSAFLYDLIYNPPVTALMAAARKAGLEVSNGMGMLARQAALAFEIWTGFPAPLEIFRNALLERTTS